MHQDTDVLSVTLQAIRVPKGQPTGCVCVFAQAIEAKVLDNLSEQTTAEKSAAKTAQDIKSLRKQGLSNCDLTCIARRQ